MIRYISLRDYRAFKKQTFRFAKLNIFAGRNNSGKSSALSALNLLAQTMNERELNGTPLLLNGQYDNLGTFIDVVHGNVARRPLAIEIGYGRYDLNLEYKYRTGRRQIELQQFQLSDRGEDVFRYSARKDAFDVYVGGKEVARAFPDIRKRRPVFRNFWPVTVVAADDFLARDRPMHPSFPEMRERYFTLNRNLASASRELEAYFDDFDSVSAFRDKPQRTYLFSGETARKIGVTGSNTAQILAADVSLRGAERGSLVESLSRWFQATNIAQEVFVRSLTSRHFEICVKSNDGSEHNICDVGFGCSQVLPVLIGGLKLFDRENPIRNRRKVLVVQEPEIHLHPNAQAALGSFFTDLIRGGGQVFIETHSDNLVLRVARHVALGEINPDDVAIFWVEDEGDSRVKEISITPDGAFSPEWPGGFFPQRHMESLELARAAFRKRPDALRQLDFRYPEEERD
jgi:predicted ATPase